MPSPPAYRFNLITQKPRSQSAVRWVLIILKLLFIPIILFSGFPWSWAVSLLLGLSSAFEYFAMKSHPNVSFYEDRIVFFGLLRKTSSWDEIENIILKDDLLTIDYRNNRLFQREVDAALDEPAFNEWCAEKLSGLKR